MLLKQLILVLGSGSTRLKKPVHFDIDKLKEVLPGIEVTTAPEGYVKVHENHHLWSKARIARAREDGQFDVVFESEELIEPNPFPAGYQ